MVRHPLSNELVPLWTSDYVLSTYGTGAVMAVPAHDERDFEFAQKFELPIRQVVAPKDSASTGGAPTPWPRESEAHYKSRTGLEMPKLEEAFTGHGVCVNSGAGLDGLTTEECKGAIVKKLVEKKRGEAKVKLPQ